MNQPDPSPQPDRPPFVARPVVLRQLLALYDKPRYLEVGVQRGRTFDRVEAADKVAVDPDFLFDHVAAERANPRAAYHQVTSDEYFGSIIGADELFDVIFLDGLHTFEQTLRDLTNALAHLQPDGVIVIDDVQPPTYLASISDRESFLTVKEWLGVQRKAWMGDVYKLVWFIDTFFQDLTYRTIGDNHGQAVIWRERRPAVTQRSVAEIAALSFEQFVLEQDVLRLADFAEILEEFKAWRNR